VETAHPWCELEPTGEPIVPLRTRFYAGSADAGDTIASDTATIRKILIEGAGIQVRGKNKWLTIIQNASHSKP
jgi:hypothetical protein